MAIEIYIYFKKLKTIVFQQQKTNYLLILIFKFKYHYLLFFVNTCIQSIICKKKSDKLFIFYISSRNSK